MSGYRIGHFVIDLDKYHQLDLTGCVAKLQRAREHLEAVNDELIRFFDSQPYGVSGQIDADGRWYVFRFQEVPEPPTRIGVLIGDYVHQVRSTLDHLARQLELWEWKFGQKRKGLPKTQARFPIETSPKGYREKACKRVASLPDEWQEFIELLQPYNSRQDNPAFDDLALLERLWNRDKHSVIAETVAFAEGFSAGHPWITPVEYVTEYPRYRLGAKLQAGAEIARVRIIDGLTDPKMEMHGKFPMYVTLDEGATKAEMGREAIWALAMAGMSVEALIRALPTVGVANLATDYPEFIALSTYQTTFRNV